MPEVVSAVKSRHHAALVIGVYATLMLDLFGSVTSSPQTTELFARDRKKTLMKYVYLADAGGFVIGVVMSLVDESPYPLFGTVAIAVPMHCLYVHAAKVGQNMAPPKTENQGGTPTGPESGKEEQGRGSVSGGTQAPTTWQSDRVA